MTYIWRFGVFPFVVFDDVPDELLGFHETKPSTARFVIKTIVAVFWLLLISILVFSVFFFSSAFTTYSISAQLEKVQVSQYCEQNNTNCTHEYPPWNLDNVELYNNCEEKETITGTLYPDKTAYITFTRIQQDDLIIDLENDEFGSVGYINTQNGKKVLGDCAYIKVPISVNQSVVFPLEGKIELGGEIKEAAKVSPVLFSGEISIIDRSIFLRDHYLVGPVNLEMGDVFIVDEIYVKSFGVLRAAKGHENDYGFRVNYTAKGKRGYIKKYKTENIEVKNGIWTKIYHDPSIIILWTLLLAAYAIFRTIIRLEMNKIDE